MRHILFLVFILVVALTATASVDRVIPPMFARATPLTAHAAALDSVIDRTGARELARLPAIAFEVAEESGMLLDGAVRPLERPVRIALPHGVGVPQVIGSITVAGARAARLRFDDVPAGTVLWLAGSEDEQFLRFEPSNSARWGPTTTGSVVYIAAEEGTGELEISELAQIAAVANAETSCLSDVACRSDEDFDHLADAIRAIGYVRFVRAGKSYVCTGGLLNDAANSGTPYFLTAEHCIGTNEEAASVEVVWDLRSEACGSNRMAKVSRSHGAELLVASPATDVALLKLASVPADRVFLGVDTRQLAPDTVVHRVSHAGGLSQTYSSGVVEQSGTSCSGASRPQFVYTRPRSGGTSGGSSGAPLLLPGLYVAGQLFGKCGPDPENTCATWNRGVDGSLRESWALLAPYLDPAGITVRRRSVR